MKKTGLRSKPLMICFSRRDEERFDQTLQKFDGKHTIYVATAHQDKHA